MPGSWARFTVHSTPSQVWLLLALILKGKDELPASSCSYGDPSVKEGGVVDPGDS